MTFTQLDDALMDSPAVLSVSRSARLLMMEGYTYCNRQLTDGYITRAQWARSTDTDSLDAEVAELLAAGVITAEGAGYRLDWSKQQTREQVLKARERKRADNERRAKSLELHKAGDHSLCTHAGGGHAKPDKSTGPSSGRSTGRSSGQKGVMDGPLDGLMELPTPLPSQPTPTHSGTEGGVGGDGALDGPDSAGAPSALGAGAAGTPQRPAVATADNLAAFGFDVATLRPEEVPHIVAVLNEPRDGDDNLDTLDGLVDAASADGHR